MECYVYQVRQDLEYESLGVRSRPTTDASYRTSVTFRPGELVCIDQMKGVPIKPLKKVQSSSSSSMKRISSSSAGRIKNGPYLRLSDSTGWLFERFNDETLLKPIPVQIGLWAFYIGNAPYGLSMRSHPVDRIEFRVRKGDTQNYFDDDHPKDSDNGTPNQDMTNGNEDDSDDNHQQGGVYVCYAPTQKIFCDRKVTNPCTGVNFYRVQGTQEWVFDKRPGMPPANPFGMNPADNIIPEGDVHMLVDENKVKTGLFAYQCIPDVNVDIGIRAWPCTSFLTGEHISPGDIVAVDMVQESPYMHGNGPFIRLADCSGWLFAKKKNALLMEEVPVTPGTWTFMVISSEGVQALRHPSDSPQMRLTTGFPHNELVECDQKVTSPISSINFYRIADTNVWICDKRTDGIPILEQVSEGPPTNNLLSNGSKSSSNGASWSPEFIRGIAFGVDNLKETEFNPPSRIISFYHDIEGAYIHVHYTTRTIVTTFDNQKKGKVQLFRKNCSSSRLRELLTNPLKHIKDDDYQRKDKMLKQNNPTINGVGEKSSSRSQPKTVDHPSLGSGFLVEAEEELRNDLFSVEKRIQHFCQERFSLLQRIRPYDKLRWDQSIQDQEIAESKVNKYETVCDIADL